jgi:hypothetical protein
MMTCKTKKEGIMKKYFSALILIIFLVMAACTASDAATAYYRSALTGGGATALDGADGARLTDGDLAFVTAGGVLYVYRLNATSGAAEDSPAVIAPDTNAGDKRWILQNVYSALAFENKTANYIFAGPASGGAALPSFRALVSGDIPDLSGSYVTPSALATALGGYIQTSVIGTLTNGKWCSSNGTSVSCTENAPQPAFGNQSANQVYAGPSSGEAAAPGFRALVSGDIPDLSSSYVTPSALSTALGGYFQTSNIDTSTSLGTSDTKVPSQNAVKVYADTKMPFSQAATTLTPDSGTPALTTEKYYYVTANTATTTYTNFTGGAAGKRIIIKVADNNSVFDFTSTNLIRAEGTDYTAVSGDVIDAISDGSNWYCRVWGINAPDGSRKAVYQNNTSIDPTASAYESYFDNGKFKINENGTEYDSAKVIASGSQALGTSEIASGACASAVDVTAAGVATTDVIDWGFNGDPTSTTGYSASANGMLTIIAYPGSGHLYLKVCNNTGGAITPGAVTLNYKVVRK